METEGNRVCQALWWTRRGVTGRLSGRGRPRPQAPGDANTWRPPEGEGPGPGHPPDGAHWPPRLGAPSGVRPPSQRRVPSRSPVSFPGLRRLWSSRRVRLPVSASASAASERIPGGSLAASVRTRSAHPECGLKTPRNFWGGGPSWSESALRTAAPDRLSCTVPSQERHHVPRKGPGRPGTYERKRIK